MKLFSRVLEKRIGDLSRREIRASKGLRREYRTFRTTWRSRLNQNRNVGWAVMAIFWVSAAIIRTATADANFVALVAPVAIPAYSIGTALVRSGKFRTRVLASAERVLFLHLPVTDEYFLNWEWLQFLKSWAKAGLIFAAAFAFAVANSAGLNWARVCIVIAAAVLQTGVALTVGLMVLAVRPRWANIVIAGPFYMLTGLVWWQRELVGRALATPMAVLPVGWLPFALSQAHIWSSRILPWPMLAAAGFAGLAVIFGHRVHAQFLMELAQHAEFRSVDAEGANVGAIDKELREQLPPPETTALPSDALDRVVAERKILGREYLQSMNLASAGWLEALTARLLPAEDLRVLDFMLGGQLPGWSKRFKFALLAAMFGGVITTMVWLPQWTTFIPAIAASLAFPLFGGLWPGFERELRSGFALPMYIAAPIPFHRIWSVVMKVNLLRLALWALIIIPYGSALAWRIGDDPAGGAFVAARIVVVVMLLQPVALLANYSQGTNDTRRLTWQSLLALPVGVLLAGGFIAALMTFWVASGVGTQILAVLGMAATSLLLYTGYMFLLTHGRIDLLSLPSRN